MGVGLEMGVKADCYFKTTLNFNFDVSNLIECKTEFSGLLVKVKFKLSFGSKKDGKKPKSIDPFKLTPSMCKSYPIKF